MNCSAVTFRGGRTEIPAQTAPVGVRHFRRGAPMFNAEVSVRIVNIVSDWLSFGWVKYRFDTPLTKS